MMLFALYYSSAKTWINSGIQVAAVIGYSFGELPALCVSGILFLKDTMRVIIARSRLVENMWGTDNGSMMAVDADLEEVYRLLADSGKICEDERPATIACYNGPRSFTLAGATKAIDAVAESSSSFPGMRVKKLTVTNAFHSCLAEPLMADLERLGQGLEFNEPIIPWERATEFKKLEKLSPAFFADHMRNPVFFKHALHRLAKEFSSCVWL